MADRQVSIRIGVTGREDAKRAFEEVGKAGRDAFNQTSTAISSAGTATDQQTSRLQRLAQAAKQAASADRAQNNFNAFMGIGTSNAGSAKASAKVFEDAAKAQEDLAARSAALRAQIDPLGAAQSKMNGAIADASHLLEAGTISEAEHAAAVALARQRYAEAEKALKAFGAASALGSSETMAFTAAIRHMVDATIAGRPPLQAMAMESGNLSYALGGKGGVMGPLKAVGGLIVSFITPTTLLAGGLLALGAGALYAYESFRSGQKELEQALTGVGRGAGATVDQLNDIAGAAASSGNISVASARDMEAAFAATGKIGADSFLGLIDLTDRYAKTLDESSDDARKEIAQAFGDPAKGAEELNARLGFLDDKTLQYIRTLEAEGETEKAQKALLDAMGPSLDDAAKKTTALGRAWDYVKNSASNAVDAVGHAISAAVDPGLEDQLRSLQEERQTAVTIGGQYLAGPMGMPAFVPSRPLAQIDADIAGVQAKIDAADAEAKRLQAQNAAKQESLQVADLVNGLIPEVRQYQDLVDEQARLQKDLANPLFRQHVADLDQTKRAYDAVSHAVETYLTPAEKAQKLAELDIRALDAKTPAEKAEIAAERERMELAGKAIPTDQAAAQIRIAATKASADAAHALGEQSQALDLNTRSSLAVANAWLKSASAAELAEARARALTEALRDGVDVQSRTQQLVQEQVAEQAEQGAKQVSDLNAEAGAQKSLNDAVAAGTMTTAEAQQAMRVEQVLRPLIVAQALAEGDAKTTLTAVIDALRGAYARLNAEQARANAQATLQSQKDQIDVLQKQIELTGTNDAQAAVQIAVLQEKQKLLGQGIDAQSKEGQKILANTALIEEQKQQVALEQQSAEELKNSFDSAFGHFTDLIAEGKADWKDWSEAARSAIGDIDKELLKLTLTNPLENLLFGQNNPTLSSVGGIFGKLIGNGASGSSSGSTSGGLFSGIEQFFAKIFHTGGTAGQGGSVRAMPAAIFRAAPRFHDGVFLSPDEVPAILQRGERVLNRGETRQYNARAAAQPTIHVTIQTPSPAAFQASKSQIAAQIVRAVQRGQRVM